MASVNELSESNLIYENLSKAVIHLPNYLRTQFYKATCDCDLTGGTTNLLSFESWLEKRIKDLFNPLAEIIAIQEATSKHKQHAKGSFKRKIFSNFMNNNADKKEKEKEKGPDEQKLERDKRNSLMCWLCKKKHRLMDCKEFKKKSIKDRIDFSTKEKICKNFFSKTHLLKDCICQMKCRINGCGKKHHTMLHLENQQQASVNSTKNQYSTNPDSVRAFLQVIPVKVKHEANTTVVNALSQVHMQH